MRTPSRLLTSRLLALALMILLVTVLAIVSLLPQGSLLLTEGAEAGRPFRTIVAVLLAAGAVAICAALVVQVRSLMRQTRRVVAPRLSGREPLVRTECVEAALTARGWRSQQLPDVDAVAFHRHPWSRWAGVALHLGLLLVMLGMSSVLLTESRSEYTLREGDVLDASAQPTMRFQAQLAPGIALDDALVLNRVDPVYWSTGELRSLDSEFRDTESGQILRVSVNSVTRWSGARLFQSRVYGRVLDVRIASPELAETVYRIEIESVPILGMPAYRDLEIPGIPGEVRIRSIETETSTGIVPEVTVRVEEDGIAKGQGTLPPAGMVTVAGYDMTLEGYGYWQTIVLVRQHGAEALIAGTFIIMISSLALYFLPSATVYVVADADGHRLILAGSRLARAAFKPDVEALLKECG
ncbi:MAG: cytochrome c biogenesis protein ResB [Coriobacteriia bacterium]|nr:cytochrome c biogenesis protein ResB [Coriobacteriia bacterium]